MVWQVRHREAGVFMGVNHGKGHYTNCSECCRSLGVYQFKSPEQIAAFIEMADSPHLPERARLKAEDFVIEEWNPNLHGLLLDEGLLDACYEWLQWSLRVYPVSLN